VARMTCLVAQIDVPAVNLSDKLPPPTFQVTRLHKQPKGLLTI
jgi:hypothetical protein